MSGRTGAVVVAAGAGRRFGGDGPPKQFRTLRGAPVLAWALRPLIEHPSVAEIVVVLPHDDVVAPPAWLDQLHVTIVAGGERRSDSVRQGLAALSSSCERVLIHDGARPFATGELIDRLLGTDGDGAVIPGLPSTDTLKEVGLDGRVVRTVDRNRYWSVQTPQLFPLGTLRRIHERARLDGVSTSDDAALFERTALPVRVIEGDPRNIKVTTTTDLAVAEFLAHQLPPPTVPPTGAAAPGLSGS